MTIPKVSVIVPLYKSEKYLTQCLDSLANQTLTDIEIIMVNDGSPDNSKNIAKAYCEKDKRFSLYSQPNHGASSARNKGFDMAKGEFIAFVDPDDWINEKSLQHLYDKSIEHGVDIAIGNVSCYVSDDNIYPYRAPYEVENKVIPGYIYFKEVNRLDKYTVMIYNYLYKTKFLKKNHLRFDEYITHEDELWTPLALLLAEKVVVTDIFHYYYRQHEESIMSNNNIKVKMNDAVYIKNRLLEFLDNILKDEKYDEIKELVFIRLSHLYSYLWELDDDNFIGELINGLLPSTHHLVQLISPIIEDTHTLRLKNAVYNKLREIING